MRLIVECEHGWRRPHVITRMGKHCEGQQSHTDPDAILAALAEAGVLEVEELFARKGPSQMVRYVSPWKEAK